MSIRPIFLQDNCESFHSKSNNIFYNAHSNIYRFTEALEYIQKDTYVYIYILTKHNSKERRIIHLNKENNISDKTLQYNEYKISRLELA